MSHTDAHDRLDPQITSVFITEERFAMELGDHAGLAAIDNEAAGSFFEQ